MLTLQDGIGMRLKEERKKHGFTQDSIADKLGIGKATQFQYEKGINLPTLKYLDALSGLGINIHYILFGTLSPNEKKSFDESRKDEIEKKALSILAKSEAEIGVMDDEKRLQMYRLIISNL
ncbi:helix-turn-helix domain-containing protein [Methylophilus sp. 3sh_L]|uniref:helix-turn-helix domain-containing protein n=1 Tax=Methylophilus sp. 3sh_L TaxID=3377114 RepID=UPI00398E55FC